MRLRSLAGILYLAATILVSSLTLTFAGEQKSFPGEINADKINLRLDATTSSQVISTLDKDRKIEVVAEFYEWYKVRLPKDVAVYIRKNLTTCINHLVITSKEQAATGPAAARCTSAKVVKDRVNIRLKPSETGAIVGLANENEIVNVTAEKGQWYEIEPVQESFGWIHKKFVNKVLAPAPLPLPVPEPENQLNSTVFSGRVEPYGVVLLRPATHKLVTADNKIFLLKGSRSSLNALNHQKVKICGRVNSSLKAKYPVIEVQSIEVAN